jgi:hypothetical protein
MSAILRAANSGDGFKPISVMLWRTLDRGPLSAGLRRLAIIGNGRIRSGTGTCAGFWFSPDPSTRPLRKPTARSQLVPEPIVEFGALAAVTDIRGMKESQDLRRSSSPIPARLTGDDLEDGPRSARFHNLRSAKRPNCPPARARTGGCRSRRPARSGNGRNAVGSRHRLDRGVGHDPTLGCFQGVRAEGTTNLRHHKIMASARVSCLPIGKALRRDSADSNPSSPESDPRPVWTAESTAVRAPDAIQTASAAGARLANTEIR